MSMCVDLVCGPCVCLTLSLISRTLARLPFALVYKLGSDSSRPRLSHAPLRFIPSSRRRTILPVAVLTQHPHLVLVCPAHIHVCSLFQALTWLYRWPKTSASGTVEHLHCMGFPRGHGGEIDDRFCQLLATFCWLPVNPGRVSHQCSVWQPGLALPNSGPAVVRLVSQFQAWACQLLRRSYFDPMLDASRFLSSGLVTAPACYEPSLALCLWG